VAAGVWLLLQRMLYADCPDGERLGAGGWCLGTRYREQLPPEQCNIARRPLSELLDEKKKLPLNEPIIFTNVTSAWPALERWTRDKLLQDSRRGKAQMTTGHPVQLLRQTFNWESELSRVTVADFIRHIRQIPEHYIFHRLPDDDNSDSPDGQSKAFYEDIEVPKRLSGKLWKKMTLALGGSSSGMLFHGHHVAWCALLYGRKRWFFLDQQDTSGRFHLEADTTNHEFVSRIYREDTHFREYWRQAGWECVQEPGELVYIPAFVQHAVLNIGESIGIVGEKCDRDRFANRPECAQPPINAGKRVPRHKLQMQ